MSNSNSNLLFLAVGAAIGAAVGYIAAYDKRNELVQDIVDYAYKVKDSMKAAAKEGKRDVNEMIDEVSKDFDAE